jgi:hypothetical protein
MSLACPLPGDCLRMDFVFAVLPKVCDLHICTPEMRSRTVQSRVVQAGKPVHALPSVSRADEPTVGAIKRALHELSRAPP